MHSFSCVQLLGCISEVTEGNAIPSVDAQAAILLNNLISKQRKKNIVNTITQIFRLRKITIMLEAGQNKLIFTII
jgi:hypothetical protein